MVLSANDFRSHVAWSARGITTIFSSEISGDSQVCDSGVTFVVQNYVLGLDIPVNNVVVVKILQSQEDAGNKEFGLLFTESSTASDMVSEVSTRH